MMQMISSHVNHTTDTTVKVAMSATLNLLLFLTPINGVAQETKTLEKHVSPQEAIQQHPRAHAVSTGASQESSLASFPPDLSGEWEIQEEDKVYHATLDQQGNGTYSWQDGRFVTTVVDRKRWQGTWYQSGNDREGAFEVVLSDDNNSAAGVWWYSRVGDRTNIPPRQWGGTYTFRRLVQSGRSTPIAIDQSASLQHQTDATVTFADTTVTVTFGPVDLPQGHDMHTAANMPWLNFTLPRDLYLVGFRSSVFTKDGKTLSREYLHHIMVLNRDKESPYCENMPYLLAGGGMEMYPARFPAGYGVKLAKGTRLLAVAAFYHMVPPAKNVMASFTLDVAPEGVELQPLEAHNVSISVDCYGKWVTRRAADETDEGIQLPPGVLVRTVPVKFFEEGCVKFAYPHGHDFLVMMALENKTTRQTLLRTMPITGSSGTLRGFHSDQVYSDSSGFFVNTHDDYDMTMVYHRPLHDAGSRHGMANYLMYMTPGGCPSVADNHPVRSPSP